MKATKLLDSDGKFRLRNLMKSRKGMWFIAWFVGTATLCASIGLLTLSGWFITSAAFAGIVSLATAFTFNYLIPSGGIRFSAIVRTAGRYGERMASHNAVLALLADLRSLAFNKLLQHPLGSYSSIHRLQRLTSDIDLLNNWPLAVILPWSWAIVMEIFTFILCGFISISLLFTVTPLLILIGNILPLMAVRKANRLAYQEAESAEIRRNALLSPLSALTPLLQWGRWQGFATCFLQKSQQVDSLQASAQSHATRYVLFQQFGFIVLFALILWHGSVLIAHDSISTAQLLALLLCLFGLSEILLPLGAKIMAVGLSMAAKDRINAIINFPEIEKITGNRFPESPLALTATHLYAKYPDALSGAEDVNFSLKTGDALIISGVSGLGKSTLLHVLAGEMPASSGQLLLNEKEYKYWQLNKAIHFLSQQLDIFDLTLASNLKLAKPEASEEELLNVLDKVGLKDWVLAQPDGLYTPLGEYGAAISGGQARRIALARLLLNKRPIMLLDEPFAGLDEENHQKILEMLKLEMADGILIIVSHLDATAKGVKMITLS